MIVHTDTGSLPRNSPIPRQRLEQFAPPPNSPRRLVPLVADVKSHSEYGVQQHHRQRIVRLTARHADAVSSAHSDQAERHGHVALARLAPRLHHRGQSARLQQEGEVRRDARYFARREPLDQDAPRRGDATGLCQPQPRSSHARVPEGQQVDEQQLCASPHVGRGRPTRRAQLADLRCAESGLRLARIRC